MESANRIRYDTSYAQPPLATTNLAICLLPLSAFAYNFDLMIDYLIIFINFLAICGGMNGYLFTTDDNLRDGRSCLLG